jgi:hypothetical protein
MSSPPEIPASSPWRNDSGEVTGRAQRHFATSVPKGERRLTWLDLEENGLKAVGRRRCGMAGLESQGDIAGAGVTDLKSGKARKTRGRFIGRTLTLSLR